MKLKITLMMISRQKKYIRNKPKEKMIIQLDLIKKIILYLIFLMKKKIKTNSWYIK